MVNKLNLQILYYWEASLILTKCSILKALYQIKAMFSFFSGTLHRVIISEIE